MGLNSINTGSIAFKKLNGKAHTQQNYALNEENIGTNVQATYSTIFAQHIEPLPVTNSGLTTLYSSNNIIERVKFQLDIIPDTEISSGRSQGYRLKLPSDYSSHPGKWYPTFGSGTYLYNSLGKLQIIPSQFGQIKADGSTEYDPILYQTNGSTIISKFDQINWILDYYNGILFIQNPPVGYDISSARPGYVEAFLYVGDYLSDVINIANSGTTGTTASNVGSGTGIFKQKIGQDLRFKSLHGINGIRVSGSTNDISISFTGATGGGTITGGTNGLTTIGNRIKLGGELIQDTLITDNVNRFNFELDANNINIFAKGVDGNMYIYGQNVTTIGSNEAQTDKSLTSLLTSQAQSTVTSNQGGELYVDSDVNIGHGRLAIFPLASGFTQSLLIDGDGFVFASPISVGTITGATNGLRLSGGGKKTALGGTITGATTIGLGTNNLTFTGTTGTIRYGGNYSANYNVRSLTDVGYVTGITTTLQLKSSFNTYTGATNSRIITIENNYVTGATSLGGNTLLGTKLGNNLRFKGLIAGSNITITPSSTGITISSSGSGSGTITGATNGLRLSGGGKKTALGGTITGATTIGLGTNNLTFTGTTGTLKYLTDQSANYTNRSIVDKGYVDRVSAQFSLKGQVINEPFTSSFSNYTTNGTATWGIVSNMLQATGGTTMVLTDYVRHSGWGSTAIRNFHTVTEVIVGTISSTSHGVWIGFQGQGVSNQSSVHFVLRLNTANQGFLESYINNTTGLFNGSDFKKVSSTALTVASGDRIRLVLDVVENEYIFKAVNLTQASTQPVSLVRTTSPITGTQWANYNTGQFALGIAGGTHAFDFHTVNVNDVVSPDILIAGDSIPTGAGVINVEQSYGKQLEGLTGLKVMRWSGGGNQSRDIKGSDIIKYTPKIVIIDIGVNDIIGGRTSIQIITDINQIITDLGAGYILGVNLFICEVLPYTTFSAQVQTYNTAFQTNYSAGLIRCYQSFNNGSGGMQSDLVNADSLHPNWKGHKLKADFIYQDFRERGILNPAIKPKSNQSQVYSYDGNVGIGSPNPFTPKLPLQVIGTSSQFSFGNDATNPSYGGSMVSTSPTAAFYSAGKYFDGSNNISAGSAGQSEIWLQDGKVAFRSNTGTAAGVIISTMTTYLQMTSSGLFGIGASNTSPISQLDISSDGTGNRGLAVASHFSNQVGNLVQLRKSRGSLQTPTANLDTDYGSYIHYQHHTGTGYITNAITGTRMNGTGTTSNLPIDYFIATSPTNSIDPYTDGTVRLLISSTGNVGIGSTSPTAKFQVRGNGTTSGLLFRLEDSAGTARMTMVNSGTTTFGGRLNYNADFSSAYNVRSIVDKGYVTGITSTLSSKSVSINTRTSNYTLQLIDNDNIVEISASTSNNITIPPNSGVTFSIGTQITTVQIGVGQTSFVSGPGVNIRSSGSKLKLTGQYSSATLYKRGINEWVLIGDLTT
jgi:lysophospholipase L1-like esterase